MAERVAPFENLAEMTAGDLRRRGVRFKSGEHLYETKGQWLGRGGTGEIWLGSRWPLDKAPETTDGDGGEPVVLKVFRQEFLVLLEQDGATRRHFEHNRVVHERLLDLRHPNVIPVLVSEPVRDNYLFVTPLVGTSLVRMAADEALSARDRAGLLIDGVRGLAALHAAGVVHRDFTPNNVLRLSAAIGTGKGDGEVVPGVRSLVAGLFDFDLSVCPRLLPEELRSYNAFYEGGVSGSPEYSVAPELLDDVLGDTTISPRIDVYAIGTTLFALFTEQPLYGEVPDLATLLDRIAKGLVHRGHSRVAYPDEVPVELRPIIDRCLERDPEARYADAHEVLRVLSRAAAQLSVARVRRRFRQTLPYVKAERRARQASVFETRSDPRLTLEEIARVDAVLGRQGYVVDRNVGRLKDHPIFLAHPDPDLLTEGRFLDDNIYPKIVTVIDLSGERDPVEVAQRWLTRIWPVLERVRQRGSTALYKIAYDAADAWLLVFSEYVADARFGTDLLKHELTLEEALGLGVVIALSISRLHAEGLAHNNVRAESLLFQGRHELGVIRALFVGLVEPSLDAEARLDDVEQLARLVRKMVSPARVDALRPELRGDVEALLDELDQLGAGKHRDPTIGRLLHVVTTTLEVIEPNFGLVRTHGGDSAAYAELLFQHSLYNKLYGRGTLSEGA